MTDEPAVAPPDSRADDPISVTRTIAAPPGRVWGLITDLTRMGEWSPENTGGRWLGGASGPALGARFRGTNHAGRRRWSTLVTVSTWEPVAEFGFDVTAAGFAVARWSYSVGPTDGGCVVTETFVDRRGKLVRAFGKLLSGTADRGEHNRIGMEATLAALAAATEG
ncbi:MAG: SRPBCC family protein [Actinomycetota bacterium]|nr:SRPBCC family protein [Actinomycetota bacterium]